MSCFTFDRTKWIFPFLFLLTLPIAGKAQFEYSTNFTYATNNAIITTNGSITITNYTGMDEIVTIPDNISGYPVTEIGSAAFEGSETLTRVAIGTNVTSIDEAAFNGCQNLANISIPSSVVNLGSGAFDDCESLNSIIIPGGVTNISDFAFADCYDLSAIYFEGNAPNLNDIVFALDPVTIYYLSNASGWIDFSDNSSIPTALWLPQIETASGLGFQTNQFGFNLSWAAGQTAIVKACTNLLNPMWLPIQTNSLSSNSVYFSDPQSKNYSRRFYQVVPQ
jgi:hypothetical protein